MNEWRQQASLGDWQTVQPGDAPASAGDGFVHVEKSEACGKAEAAPFDDAEQIAKTDSVEDIFAKLDSAGDDFVVMYRKLSATIKSFKGLPMTWGG
jgi:hypothetical protein